MVEECWDTWMPQGDICRCFKAQTMHIVHALRIAGWHVVGFLRNDVEADFQLQYQDVKK